MREPEEAMMKDALKKGKTTEERTKKNISMDVMGDKLGRIHMGKQDMGDLQTRKMKGLKRSRDEVVEDNDASAVADEEPKKRRT
jgi:ribosome production factor 2